MFYISLRCKSANLIFYNDSTVLYFEILFSCIYHRSVLQEYTSDKLKDLFVWGFQFAFKNVIIEYHIKYCGNFYYWVSKFFMDIACVKSDDSVWRVYMNFMGTEIVETMVV